MRFPRSSGILLHPTSLPGPYGSGDMGAGAYHFVDWLISAGQKMWQILPLGGVGPGNSPYMSSSAFAGNLLLIDLEELRTQGWLTADELQVHAEFNPQKIDYKRVTEFRMSMLQRAAARFFSGQNDTYAEYSAFCSEEQVWLDDFSLFMALSGKFDGKDWGGWEADLVRREPAAMSKSATDLSDEISFWKFSQWCFFRQWRKLKKYANERGVLIIGDMPIFIAYQSAEVWARQELFELGDDNLPTVVAGVPPDYFSSTGQRWGNPIYNWQAHEQEGYAWWIQRLRKKIELVDIVRIDHFRGFSGYWEIPASEQFAINGRWMAGPGEKLFNAVQLAMGRLPIIAEDLGVITPDVVALLEKFDLPGMRVLQFAFDGNTNNPYLPHNHIKNSVVYAGTHDNDTSIGWYGTASASARNFVCKYLRTDASEINWDLIHAASQSVADIAIHTLQDVLDLDGEHRMNLPGKSEGYWEWRFSWEQVKPVHAAKLYEVTALHGRCVADRLKL